MAQASLAGSKNDRYPKEIQRMTVKNESAELNSDRIHIPPVARKDLWLVGTSIVLSHLMLVLSMILLTKTAMAIPFVAFFFYIVILSPSMVIVLRERPIEGIQIALPYLTTVPKWSLLTGAGLLLLYQGIGFLIGFRGSAELSWLLEVLQSLALNAVILLYIFASASTLGLTLAFYLDKHRLD